MKNPFSAKTPAEWLEARYERTAELAAREQELMKKIARAKYGSAGDLAAAGRDLRALYQELKDLGGQP
ncbi:hypothetical protein [Marinactinospora rubrisoli]|uniref:Uncharacterized protein n=1 Tax=Marinactinospora rubrisoli TaxID=2715399 RepID=A0ABW2KNC7_9ACTN